MGKIPFPDGFHVSAAIGWLELGNYLEAKAELDQVGERYREHPDYLVPAWLVDQRQGDWGRATATAQKLFRAKSQRSYAWVLLAASLAESAGAQAAYEFLMQAPMRFPGDTSVRYNLAVLACRCGLMREARDWLVETLAIAKAAASESELKDWSAIGALGAAAKVVLT